ncbi:MAG: carboxypeptidase-like regulatory domain-containing protein [Armatimonadota bacterium]
MRRNIYRTSARELALIATVLILVFCAGLASYAQSTVSGTITRAGVPCPNARVVLADNSGTIFTALTDSNGNYIISNMVNGTYIFTANALKATAVEQTVTVNSGDNITLTVDLAYGHTPLYDDFSGTSVDMDKWEKFNADNPLLGNPGEATVSTTDGMLNISAAANKGGLISKNPVPKNCTIEYVMPKHYAGTDQCFTIIKDKVSHYSNYVTVQDKGNVTTEANLIAYNNTTSSAWTRNNNYDVVYPAKITILKTGCHFDFFINGALKYCLSPTITDEAYIYLYGNTMTDGGTTAYFDDIYAGATVPVTVNSVAETRTAAADTYHTISNVVVTASFDNAFWVESSDRSSGIKVISTEKPRLGKRMTIYGKIVRQNGEVAIQAEDTVTGDTVTTKPTAVAITGKVAKELDKAGASAQGLFVKVTGKVTEIVTNTENTKIAGYYLDDGSGITAGSHKGLYVKMADCITLPVGTINVGDFITREGPLTIYMADSTTPVPSIIATRGLEYGPVGFVAYNDVVYSPAYPDGGSKITHYSCVDNPDVNDDFAGGPLKDYATGNYVGESAVVTVPNTISLRGLQSAAGGNPTAGDAVTYFTDGNGNTIVNLVGCIYTDKNYDTIPIYGWYFDMTFYGLDPNAYYEFVSTVDRNESRNLPIRYIIYDYAERTYACSSFLGLSSYYYSKQSDDSCIMSSGDYQNTAGCVARWINIKPLPSGTFRVRMNSPYVQEGYGPGAFRLRKQAGWETPPIY